MLTPIDDALVEGLETTSAAYTRGTPSGVGININDNDNASPITTIGIVFATHGTSTNTPTQSILTNGVQVQWMQATDPLGTNRVPRRFLRIKILPVP